MARAFPHGGLAWPTTDPFLLLDDFRVPADASFPDTSSKEGLPIGTARGSMCPSPPVASCISHAGAVSAMPSFPSAVASPAACSSGSTCRGGSKASNPRPRPGQAENVPEEAIPRGRVRTVAGKKGRVELYTHLELEAGASWQGPLSAGWAAVVYVLEGSLAVVLQQIQAVLPARAAFMAGPHPVSRSLCGLRMGGFS